MNLSGYGYDTNIPKQDIVMDDVDITPDTSDAYIAKFARGVRAIFYARKRKMNVLVHCAAGINRSSTTIGLYLVYKGWPYQNIMSVLSSANKQRNVPLFTNSTFRDLVQTAAALNQNFQKIAD